MHLFFENRNAYVFSIFGFFFASLSLQNGKTLNIALFTNTRSAVAPVLQKRLEGFMMCMAVVSQKKTQCVIGSNVFVLENSTCKTCPMDGRSPRLIMKN